jgi:hypothetical protein
VFEARNSCGRTRLSLSFRIPARYRCGIIEIVCEEPPMTPNQSQQSEPFPREPIPLEILEWARQTLDETEFLAHVREIEMTGGVQFEDFIVELEARAKAK